MRLLIGAFFLLLCSLARARMQCPAGYSTKVGLDSSYRFWILCCANGTGSPYGGNVCQSPAPGDFRVYCDEVFPTIAGVCACWLHCGGTVQATPTIACISSPGDNCTCGGNCCLAGAPCNSTAPTRAPTAPTTAPTPAPTPAPTAPTASPTPAPVAPTTIAAPTNGAAAHGPPVLALVALCLLSFFVF
jgi:hypothetical protein